MTLVGLELDRLGAPTRQDNGMGLHLVGRLRKLTASIVGECYGATIEQYKADVAEARKQLATAREELTRAQSSFDAVLESNNAVADKRYQEYEAQLAMAETRQETRLRELLEKAGHSGFSPYHFELWSDGCWRVKDSAGKILVESTTFEKHEGIAGAIAALEALVEKTKPQEPTPDTSIEDFLTGAPSKPKNPTQEESVFILCIEQAWGIIANAYGGTWREATPEWCKTACEWYYEWEHLLEMESSEEIKRVFLDYEEGDVRVAQQKPTAEEVINNAKCHHHSEWTDDLIALAERLLKEKTERTKQEKQEPTPEDVIAKCQREHCGPSVNAVCDLAERLVKGAK